MFCGKNTNVIELYNLILKATEANQRTWYNSGIGTYARPSWKSLKHYKKVLYHKIDLAIAWYVQSQVSQSCFHFSLGFQGFWTNSFGCISLAIRQLWGGRLYLFIRWVATTYSVDIDAYQMILQGFLVEHFKSAFCQQWSTRYDAFRFVRCSKLTSAGLYRLDLSIKETRCRYHCKHRAIIFLCTDWSL